MFILSYTFCDNYMIFTIKSFTFLRVLVYRNSLLPLSYDLFQLHYVLFVLFLRGIRYNEAACLLRLDWKNIKSIYIKYVWNKLVLTILWYYNSM